MNDLLSYWRDHPPVHMLLGACLLKPAASQTSEHSAQTELSQLKHTVAALGGSIGKKLTEAYRQKGS